MPRLPWWATRGEKQEPGAAEVEAVGDAIQKALVGKPVIVSLGAGLSISVAAAKELKMTKERVFSLMAAMWDEVERADPESVRKVH